MSEEKVKYYKNKYFFVFYDKKDEILKYMFNNVYEILKFINKPITKNNLYLLRTEIYRALKSESHLCRFINGEHLKVYIIDVESN